MNVSNVTKDLSLLALLISAYSVYTSRQSLRIARQQEKGRKPLLVSYLSDCYVKFDEDEGRSYAFLVSIGDRSDTSNGISEMDLRITYISTANEPITVSLRSNPKLAGRFPYTRDSPFLSISTRIDAHQTVLGWCYFYVDGKILKGQRGIETFVVSIKDSPGLEITLNPIAIQEYGSEIAPEGSYGDNSERA